MQREWGDADVRKLSVESLFIEKVIGDDADLPSSSRYSQRVEHEGNTQGRKRGLESGGGRSHEVDESPTPPYIAVRGF